LLPLGLNQPRKVSPVTVHVTDTVAPTLAGTRGNDSFTSAPRTIEKGLIVSSLTKL